MTQPEVELAYNAGEIEFSDMVRELARCNAYNKLDTIDDIEGVLQGVLTKETEEKVTALIKQTEEEDKNAKTN